MFSLFRRITETKYVSGLKLEFLGLYNITGNHVKRELMIELAVKDIC